MLRKGIKAGPDSAKVLGSVRAELAAGVFSVGQFLPGARELANDHQVSFGTARRALKILEAEGLVVAEPRHGFQVVRIPDKKKMAIIAYVLSQGTSGKFNYLSTLIMAVFQRIASQHGLSLLGIGADSSNTADIVRTIRQAGAAGVVLDAENPELIDAVEKLGLPTVNAEVWSAARRFDAVGQDNFGGALLAAEYMVSRGHQRIAWIGRLPGSIEADERWAGAVAGLRRHGLKLAAEILQGALWRDSEAFEALLRLPERPTGFICLWANLAIGAARTAARLGLRIGRDFDLVGWATDEQYDDYRLSFPEGQVPATVTWSIERLAENVIARLTERQAKPNLPVVRTIVETRLRRGPAEAAGQGASKTIDLYSPATEGQLVQT